MLKVTCPPATGSAKALLTEADSCVAKRELMVALCGVPAVAAMLKPRDSKEPMSTAPTRPVPR
jgi:hypothetical protein